MGSMAPVPRSLDHMLYCGQMGHFGRPLGRVGPPKVGSVSRWLQASLAELWLHLWGARTAADCPRALNVKVYAEDDT